MCDISFYTSAKQIMFVYSNMRKLVAYILIAITLLSNGMVDFAIKVCHDSNLGANTYGVFEQKSMVEFSNAAESECKTNIKSSKNTNYNTNNNKISKKYLQKKSCCSTKSSVQKSESKYLNTININNQKKSPINSWSLLKEVFFSSDEHPCCSDNSKAQIKCCTLLNLYYFTPKFLEETEDLVPNIVWHDILSSGELMRFQSLDQLSYNHFKFMDRSDPLVPNCEDISSSFCVWII